MLGGIAAGLMQGLQARTQEKEARESRAMQKKLLDLQLQQGNIKSQQTQMKMSILTELLKRMNLPGISQDQALTETAPGIETPEATGPVFAESFGPLKTKKTPTEGIALPSTAQSITDQYATGAELPSIADMIASAKTQGALGGGMPGSAAAPSPGGQQIGAGGTPLQAGGPTAQQGVSDLLAQAIVGNMLDLPLLDVARMNEQMRHNRILESKQQAFEYTDEQGAKHRVFVPSYPGAGQAPGAPGAASDRQLQIQAMNQNQMAGPGTMIAPAPVEVQTYEENGRTFEVLVNKQTRRRISKPIQVKELKGESSETAGKISLAKQAITLVDQLRSAWINPDGSINRPLLASARANLGAGRQQRAQFHDALDARQRASSGAAIGKDEEARYFDMYFPNPVLDDDATVKDKMKRLGNFMTDYLEVMDPNGKYRQQYNFYGKDQGGAGGGQQTVTLPKQALSALKEGMATRFKNGQIWTLENGNPKRLDQ